METPDAFFLDNGTQKNIQAASVQEHFVCYVINSHCFFFPPLQFLLSARLSDAFQLRFQVFYWPIFNLDAGALVDNVRIKVMRRYAG